MMVAAGSDILPRNGDDEPLTGEGVRQVLTAYKTMWDEGLIPESAAGTTTRTVTWRRLAPSP